MAQSATSHTPLPFVVFLALLGLLSQAGGPLLASDTGPASTAQAATITVNLEYQEVGYPILQHSFFSPPAPPAFTKEPDFGSHRVIRHSLTLGPDAKSGISIAWDTTAEKLYLDLNRNGDLTDDTNGVVAAGSRAFYQVFPNVRIPLTPDADGPAALIDVNLADRQPSLFGYVTLRSLWQGRVRVAERDWQVGLVATDTDSQRPRSLLVRPWERREEPFTVDGGSADAFRWPQRLFWLEQGYTATAQYPSSGSPRQWRVEFTPVDSARGELTLSGQHLSRVLLAGDEWTVLLDNPPSVVRVPPATYSISAVLLAKDGARAHRDNTGPSGNLSTVKVGTEAPAVCSAGGPLTNRVSVTRRARLLILNYQLVGADGAAYTIANLDRSRPPEFAVHQGERELATGKFEFG